MPEWCWQRFVLLDESLNISFEGGRFRQGILFFIHVYTVEHGYDQMLARREFHIEMEIRSFERQSLVLKSLALTLCVTVFILPKQKETEWGFRNYYFVKDRRGSRYNRHTKKERNKICLLIIPLHKNGIYKLPWRVCISSSSRQEWG